jgi:hypothetical protein
MKRVHVSREIPNRLIETFLDQDTIPAIAAGNSETRCKMNSHGGSCIDLAQLTERRLENAASMNEMVP